MEPMRELSVLVPLDGSKLGECAVPVALGLTEDLKGHLKLVSVSANGHVTQRSRVSSISPEHLEPLDPELSDYLNRVGDMIETASEVKVSRVVLEGAATKALLEFDSLSHPDLIVMSTHGRGPLSRAWIGSVADWLIRHISTPVVLVRPQEVAECDVTEPNRIRRILVPLDGSEEAEGSLEWAKRIMAATGASCTLLRVADVSFPAWSSPRDPWRRLGQTAVTVEGDTEIHQKFGRTAKVVVFTSDYEEASCTQSQEYLDKVKVSLQTSGFDVDTVVEGEGSGAAGILRCADEGMIDLIVMASHGRGGLKRLLLGSVADKVVRAADVPVLLVRPE